MLALGPFSDEVSKIFHIFDKTVPYRTKLVCTKLDWACWGGNQSQLFYRQNDCSNACGIRVVNTSPLQSQHSMGAAVWLFGRAL